MAILPQIRRLLIDDFASQKSWIEPLLLVENSFAEAVVNALNKRLSLRDNTTGDVLTLLLSAVPTTQTPASVTWQKPLQPTAVLVGNAVLAVGGPATLTGPLGVQWQMNGNQLQITNLFGVVPTSSFQINLTLVVLAG